MNKDFNENIRQVTNENHLLMMSKNVRIEKSRGEFKDDLGKKT